MGKLILLDSGHGGLNEGRYTTPGKRHRFGKEVIHEGVLNRAVVNLLAFQLDLVGIPCHIIAPENKDISLRERVRRVNKLCVSYSCFLLSVHHNWFSNEKVSGAEFFTSKGETVSDMFAEEMCTNFEKWYPNRHLRKNILDQDKKSKEANFYILSRTLCPAVLSEWGFMSNFHEFSMLSSPSGINEQVEFLFMSISEIYKKL